MNTSRQTKVRSIVVLIVAALLLELTTMVQYYATKENITQQITETARRDLNATNSTAELKNEVEKAVDKILPQVERLTCSDQVDSVKILIRQFLKDRHGIVGIDYCLTEAVRPTPEGYYIFQDEKKPHVLNENAIDFDFTKRSWYKEGLQNNGFWSEPYKSRYRIAWMCTYSMPITNPQGDAIGVIGADVLLSEISALASELYEDQQRSILYVILLHVFGLGVLAFIIQRAVSSESKLLQVETEKERIASELSIARGIQQAMLPKAFPPFPDRDDVDIYASLTPAREVGGDFYDFFLRDEKMFFCVGDVSGKGVPAALVMAMACSMFRMLCARETMPDKIVTAMNDTMATDNEYNMFITLFVGVLDLPTGRLRFCNAGHPAPLLDGEPVSVNANLAVGVMPYVKFSTQEMMVRPGDTLFLFTDGLNEAENADNMQFGKKRVTEICTAEKEDNEATPMGITHRLVEKMTSAVKSFVGDREQSDDLTMLAIQYTRHTGDVRLCCDITLPCNVKEVPRLADFVDSVCFALDFSPAVTMQVNLALEEAVVNVINYAYPPDARGEVRVEALANEKWLKFVVTDSGRPFDPTTMGAADISAPVEERAIGGLGIHLVRRYMDSINYERLDERNVLTLWKKLT